MFRHHDADFARKALDHFSRLNRSELQQAFLHIFRLNAKVLVSDVESALLDKRSLVLNVLPVK